MLQTTMMSAKRFAISTEAASLLTSYNLKEEHYNKEISRDHIIEFIKYYGHTWRKEHLYKHLVSNSKTIISDIENERKYSEEDKRHQFFLKWQEARGSEATYEALVNALLKAKCEKGAKYLCKVLQECGNEGISVRDIYSSTTSDSESEKELEESMKQKQKREQSLKDQLRLIEREVGELQRQNERLQKKDLKHMKILEQKESEVTDLKDELRKVKTELKEVKRKLRQAQKGHKAKDKEIKILSNELSAMKALPERNSQKKTDQVKLVGFKQGRPSPHPGNNQVNGDDAEEQPLISKLSKHRPGYGDHGSCGDHCNNFKCGSTSWILCCLGCVWLVTLLLFIILLATLPDLPSGSTVVGGSDIVLASSFHSSDFTVHFKIDETATRGPVTVPVNYYQGLCSEFDRRLCLELRNTTKQLSLSEGIQYGIEKEYLIRGSSVAFTFSTPEPLLHPSSTACVTSIFIFQDHLDYLQFISTGLINLEVSSHCVSPTSGVNFTLSAVDANAYYFIALNSHESATLNYTVTGDVLEYDVNGLSPSTCTFPVSDCSVSLNHNRTAGDSEICILASLLNPDTFLALNYTTSSWKHTMQTIVTLTMCGLCIGPLLLAGFIGFALAIITVVVSCSKILIMKFRC